MNAVRVRSSTASRGTGPWYQLGLIISIGTDHQLQFMQATTVPGKLESAVLKPPEKILWDRPSTGFQLRYSRSAEADNQRYVVIWRSNSLGKVSRILKDVIIFACDVAFCETLDGQTQLYLSCTEVELVEQLLFWTVGWNAHWKVFINIS